MRKKRGYKREVSLERDYKLFAIVCEGSKREPDYFKLFRFASKRIAVDIIEEKVSDEQVSPDVKNKSAPKWLLDRAVKYIEKEGLNDEDDLWFVMDVDRWKSEQIREIAEYCEKYPNWHIVISNPCFEVWLYLHKRKNLSSSNTCSEFKTELASFDKVGYNPYTYIPDIINAIKNSKTLNKDEYFLNEKD
ncbi:RloB family protein [Sphingobacterium cellulitidis]|uniref:RloB family protein n=1 Tax=Sphingobacterium cellulitidis TaxID=1768011 RepID=UPI00370DC384